MNQNPLKISKIVYPLVALTLILVIISTTTFSWLKSDLSSNISNNEFIEIDADAGLQLSYGENFETLGAIEITQFGNTLSECSSADGRNFFFPISNYAPAPDGDGDFVETVVTDDLIYREGTANDKTNKYISVDFKLTASADASVYLSDKSFISGDAADAVRLSLYFHDGITQPIVIDNADPTYGNTNKAITTISPEGVVTGTKDVNPLAIGDHINNGTNKSLFNLKTGESMTITMNIWLEGTDPDCNAAILSKSDLEIKLEFTTALANTNTITFVDKTLEEWVEDDTIKLFVRDITDKTENGMQYIMTKLEGENVWTANVPESVETIEFIRRNPTNANERIYNTFEAGDIGECKTYVAFGHNTGMWTNDTSAFTTITLFDGTPNGYLQKDDAEMHLLFSIKDGNDSTQDFNYKFSYQNTYHRWQIVIPTAASEISFRRMHYSFDSQHNYQYDDKGNYKIIEQYGAEWTTNMVGNRGSNQYITLNSSNSGYWGNRVLLLDDSNKKLKEESEFAACFYSNFTPNSDSQQPEHQNIPTDVIWSGMRATNAKGRYVVVVPEGKTYVAFCRAKNDVSSYDITNTNNIYNRTHHQYNEFGTNNLFKLMDYWNNPNYYMWGDPWYTTDDGI